MSQQQGEFIFIMLKPAAANDIKLCNFIKNDLAKYGDIKHIRNCVTVEKQKILKHYEASKSSLWYPFIINYLSNKPVSFFILESAPGQSYLDTDCNRCSFGKFLKVQVIGPADICKTKKYHIRRLALKKPTFLLDNLIHSSDNTKDALEEIRIWYQDEPKVIAEFEKKSIVISD
jgi:nucleoside diphosphate kinase